MVGILTILTVIIGAQGLPGKCGHAERQNFTVPRIPIQRETGRELSRGGSWSPIRIQVYYGPLDLSSSNENRLKNAVDSAINWFKSALLVKPISAAWQLPSDNCDGDKYNGDILTASFDADYVFYVYGDEKDNGLAGSATYCSQDASTEQPILGSYYFNGKSHEDMTDEGVLSTTIHEMTHALVFSNELFTQFQKSDGSKYSTSEIYVTENVRGMSKMKLAFPTVLAKARTGFGCFSLNGVELESDGGEGTAGVHWEKRIMYNDYMVADSNITDIAYTDVSLALFKDSGWYDVDYKYSTVLNWGYGEGCGFISQKCVTGGKAISADFCTVMGSGSLDMCDFMHLRKGTCNLIMQSETLPTQYQYFSSAAEGGSDEYLDYCPVVKAASDGDCRDTNSVTLSDDYGEEAGFTSRCLAGNYSKFGDTKEHAGCHKVTCSGSIATVTIGGTTVQCPATGGDVQVTGMTGFVHCPASNVLCRDMPCVNNCAGFGYCQASQCACQDGTESCQTYSSAGVFLAFLPLVLIA